MTLGQEFSGFAVTLGDDVTVAMASEAGQLQLNAFGPVVAVALLGSLKWLTAAMATLRENCVDGISANRERLAQQKSTESDIRE